MARNVRQSQTLFITHLFQGDAKPFFLYTIRLVDIGNEACIRQHSNFFVIQIIVKSRHHIDL